MTGHGGDGMISDFILHSSIHNKTPQDEIISNEALSLICFNWIYGRPAAIIAKL